MEYIDMFMEIILMVFLAFIFGPIMLFTFPFSIYHKLTFALGLSLALFLFIMGIKNTNKYGKIILIILGLSIWLFLSFVGFGTGS